MGVVLVGYSKGVLNLVFNIMNSYMYMYIMEVFKNKLFFFVLKECKHRTIAVSSNVHATKK